jgi:hypothetical protein
MKKPDSDEDSREIAVLEAREADVRLRKELPEVDDPELREEEDEEELERQKWLVWEAWKVGLV